MNDDNQETTPIEEIDLRPLAELSGAERAFVSYYVSSPETLRQLGDRAKRVRALLAAQPAELEHFESSLEMLEGWLEEHAPSSFEGLVVFASWALDFVRGYVLTLPLPDQLRVDASPYLRPLAELQDEYESFAVVAADSGGTRIFIVASARVEEEERVAGEVKNRVKKGGWSQKRYARRRENQLHHYAADVVERLQGLAAGEEFGRIVLLGAEETLREIRDALPTDLAERVVGAEGADLGESREELVAEGFELFFAAERQSEEDLWESIEEEGLSHDLAALGATEVLAAARQGRVEAMIVSRDAAIAGTRCRECEHVVHGTPSSCQSCGSASVFEVDLVDELVHLLETSGATVDFADSIPGLTEVGEVAALLRY